MRRQNPLLCMVVLLAMTALCMPVQAQQSYPQAYPYPSSTFPQPSWQTPASNNSGQPGYGGYRQPAPMGSSAPQPQYQAMPRQQVMSPANTPYPDADSNPNFDSYYNDLQNATSAIEQGRITEGINLLERAKTVAPVESLAIVLNNLASAYIKRGNVYHNQQKQYTLGLADFRKAIFYLDAGWPEGLAKKPLNDNNLKIAHENLDIAYEANKIPLKDKQVHLKLAKDLRAAGKFEEAVVEYAQVLKLDPANADVAKALGDVFTVLNLPEKSKKYYTAAGNKLDNQSLVKLANAQNQSGEQQKAVDTLNRALEDNPNNPAALAQLKTIWETELRYNPGNVAAHANLASILQKMKAYPDAEREYLIAEDLATKDNNTPFLVKKLLRLNLGTLYQDTKRYPKALEVYDTVLKVEPNDPTANYYKAVLYKEVGQSDDAVTLYIKLLRIDPKNSKARKELMALLSEPGSDGGLKRYADSFPQDAALQAAVGEIFHSRKQYDQALAYYQRSIAINPRVASVQANLGAVYQAMGQTDAAQQALATAAKLDPKNNTFQSLAGQVQDNRLSEQYQQALTLQQQEKFADSLPLLAKLVQQAPGNADYQASYGVALQQAGHLKDAIAAYEKAVAVNPKSAPFYYSLGTAYHQLKQYPQAKLAYQKALALDPRMTDAKDALALLDKSQATQSLSDATTAYQQKNYLKASKLIQVAIAQDPGNATAYYYRGLIQQAQQQPDAAIASYRKASQTDPTFADAYYAMAVLLDAKKDNTGAKQAYESFIKKSGSTGDSTYVQYAKQRLQNL